EEEKEEAAGRRRGGGEPLPPVEAQHLRADHHAGDPARHSRSAWVSALQEEDRGGAGFVAARAAIRAGVWARRLTVRSRAQTHRATRPHWVPRRPGLDFTSCWIIRT